MVDDHAECAAVLGCLSPCPQRQQRLLPEQARARNLLRQAQAWRCSSIGVTRLSRRTTIAWIFETHTRSQVQAVLPCRCHRWHSAGAGPGFCCEKEDCTPLYNRNLDQLPLSAIYGTGCFSGVSHNGKQSCLGTSHGGHCLCPL